MVSARQGGGSSSGASASPQSSSNLRPRGPTSSHRPPTQAEPVAQHVSLSLIVSLHRPPPLAKRRASISSRNAMFTAVSDPSLLHEQSPAGMPMHSDASPSGGVPVQARSSGR